MYKIAFAQIDCRDDGATGYDPIAFTADAYTRNGTPYERPALLGKENAKLAIFMKREYLTKLRILQEEIRNKYIFLANHRELEVQDSDWFHALNEEESKKIENEAKVFFPGEQASYYT